MFVTSSFQRHWIQVSRQLKDVFTPKNFPLILGIAGTARYSEIAIKALCGIRQDKYLLGPLKFLALGTAGLNTYEMMKNAGRLAKVSGREKIETALKMISNMSSISYSTETFLGAITSLGLIRKMTWLPLFSVGGVVLESVATTLELKGLQESYRFSKEFDQASNLKKKKECTLEDYQRVVSLLKQKQEKEKVFISKNFEIDEDILIDRLNEIEAIAKAKLTSSDPAEVSEGKQLLDSTIKAFRYKNTLKKRCHIVVSATSTADVISVGLLLTPLDLLGCGILAGAGLTSLGMSAYKKRMDEQFKTAVLGPLAKMTKKS